MLSYQKAEAQDAMFNADSSITYQLSRFKVGDTVQLFYGSGIDKSFEFLEVTNYNTLKSGKAASDFKT